MQVPQHLLFNLIKLHYRHKRNQVLLFKAVSVFFVCFNDFLAYLLITLYVNKPENRNYQNKFNSEN